MAKSRKRRKNYKLRKRVMRTVSALTMAMAVTVAAIPVERYGTMEAAPRAVPTEDVDMATKYSSDSDVINEDNNKYPDSGGDKENAYSDEITIQRVDEGRNTLIDAYKAKKSSFNSDAIVSGVADLDTFTVEGTEYYNYILFGNDYLNKLQENAKVGEDKISQSSLAINFDDGDMVTLSGGKYKINGTEGEQTLKGIGSVRKINETYDNNLSTISLDKLDASGKIGENKYVTVKGSTVNVKEIFTACESAAVEAKKADIQTYNEKVSDIEDIQKKLADSIPTDANTLTQQELDLWNDFSAHHQEYYNAAGTLTIEFDALSDANDNELKDALEYIITKYYIDGSNSLEDFSLVKMTNGDDTVYLAKLNDGKTHPNTQKIDDKGYLVEDKVNIKGIKSEAFINCQTISDITLTPAVEFIGDTAFKDSQLQKITIQNTKDGDKTGCTIIGDEAFSGSQLDTITFSNTDTGSNLKTIGGKAFYKTKLTQVTIPSSVTEMGSECFAETSSLNDITFANGNSTDLKIGAYAFYNCENIDTVIFPNDRPVQMKNGCFALAEEKNGGKSMTSFTFPEKNTKICFDDNCYKYTSNGKDDDDYYPSVGGGKNEKCKYDYILGGRYELQQVTWPAVLTGTIPDNTLYGCYHLGLAIFPETAQTATYFPSDKTGKYTRGLFRYVTNDEFYVKGPKEGAASKSIASPRQCTWEATAGYDVDGKPGPVPYMFTDETGDHFEIGYDDAKYIATVDVIDEKTAKLTSYMVNPKNRGEDTDRVAVSIGKVGKYTIVEIGENCFDEEAKQRIYKLTLEDGAVQKLDAGAFKGTKNLQWVYIGNDVKDIGSEAFADCPKLENIYFSQTDSAAWNDDDPYWSELQVPDDAFRTGSDRLTFHGDINENFRPFQIAMSGDNYDGNGKCTLTGTGIAVCYKTDEPLNLTVIRNRKDGKATLVDYPHYEEVNTINADYLAKKYPYVDDDGTAFKPDEPSNKQKKDKVDAKRNIKGKFEKIYGLAAGDSDVTEMPADEMEIINDALNIKLPSGIESVDSASFLTETEDNDPTKSNKEEQWYLYHKYVLGKDSNDQDEYQSDKDKGGEIDDRELLSPKKVKKAGAKSPTFIVDLYSKNGEDTNDTYDERYQTAIDKDGVADGRNVAVGGLFSGLFTAIDQSAQDFTQDIELNTNRHIFTGSEVSGIYEGQLYRERYSAGNDYLTTIDLGTVSELPDYAFDSCENLLRVTFGEEMQDVGILPFRGCVNLYNIATGGSPYDFNDMILYKINDGGTAKIVECLEGRGKNGDGVLDNSFGTYKNSEVTIPDGYDVTEMDKYAFANCKYVGGVDLSNTRLRVLPEGAFQNDEALREVKLPATVNNIGDYAFYGVEGNLSLTIPNPNCALSNYAFNFDDTSTVTIRGVKYEDEASGLTSTTWETYTQLKDALAKEHKQDNIVWAEYDKEYIVTWLDYDLSVIKQDTVLKGGSVTPPADPKRNGYKFTGWISRIGGDVITDKDDPKPYENVTEDRTIIATYETDFKSVVSDGNDYQLTVNNGKALIGGEVVTTFPVSLKGGDSVTLMAADEEKFSVWTTDPREYISLVDNPSAYTSLFTMPNKDVTVTANDAVDSGSQTPGGSGSDNPGGSGSGGDNQGGSGSGDNDNKTKYKLTVNYGSGSGEYEAGTSVTISAYAPESSSRVFSRWTSNNSSLGFASATSATTTLVMPAADATVTANYKARVDDDDEDDDDTSRRPNTNTTTTVTNPSSNSGSNGSNTSGTVTNNNNNNNNGGSKIYITKNGVSNKDLASVSVSGSTDNFIVRISETDEATAAAEEALINRYGSLDGLVYFPMDISLYDSTGQNKITDTYGLNITITMPIPDVLIQYGGNSRVAATDNGTLQALNPVKFTTIDGIACISFVPPHFSPYVIYVDTNNLTAGQTLDSTPSTGDPIHPKWFLALGMACVSVILFAASDGRKRKKYRTA